MIEKVRSYIKKQDMVKPGSKIVLGVSGGADSVALLLVLLALSKEYKLSLWVCHIHHGIREEADADAAYVEALCKMHGIPFFLYRGDVKAMAAEQKKSLEEMGREYRYQCFFEVMKKTGADTLAVAHHRKDQAETVLFHIVRGSNLAGLGGMCPVTEFWEEVPGTERKRIIRPLLECGKEEIVKWLEEQGVGWQEDVTNADTIYARNCIRNEVLPLLTRINEQAEVHLCELAETMREQKDFVQQMLNRFWAEAVHLVVNPSGEECGLCVERRRLKEEHPVLAQAVIYAMLEQVCGTKKDLARKHVEAVYELLTMQSGKKISLPAEIEAVLSYEKLTIRKCFRQEEEYDWSFPVFLGDLQRDSAICIALPFGGSLTVEYLDIAMWNNEEREKILQTARNSKFNYTKFFDCATIKNTLCVRTVEKDDYFVFDAAGNRKRMTRYFMDNKILEENRRRSLVLATEHEVLWVLGGRRSEKFKIHEDTQYILKVTYEGEENDESD